MIAPRGEIERRDPAYGGFDDGAGAHAPTYSLREAAAILGVNPTVAGRAELSARFKFCAGLLLNLLEDPLHGEAFAVRLLVEYAADREMQMVVSLAMHLGESGMRSNAVDIFDALDQDDLEALGLDGLEDLDAGADAERFDPYGDDPDQLALFAELGLADDVDFTDPEPIDLFDAAAA